MISYLALIPLPFAVVTILGGIAMWLVSFVLHGVVLGNTYIGLPEVFSQEQANPFHFLLIELCVAIPMTFLFLKTRQCWSPGIMGGLTFGFWIGLVGAFAQFFNPLVIDGFPYYLAWCWFGTNVIIAMVMGAVLGLFIKREV